MKKISGVLDKMFHTLAAIGFGCVMVCVLIQIIARYLPFISAPWTDEMTRLFFLYTVMIGCPMSIRYHEYASIDVIATRLTGRLRRLLNIIVDVVILVVCFAGIPQAKLYFTVGTRSLSTSLQINLGIFYVIPLGIFLLTAVYGVVDLVNEILLMQKGE